MTPNTFHSQGYLKFTRNFLFIFILYYLQYVEERELEPKGELDNALNYKDLGYINNNNVIMN
jgi:hypothetical protein